MISMISMIVLVGSYLPLLAAIPGYTKLFKAIYQHQLHHEESVVEPLPLIHLAEVDHLELS
jgi:hypothetical protein